MRWVGHVAGMREKRNALIYRGEARRMDNIMIDLREKE
jgi:hypothetical protein